MEATRSCYWTPFPQPIISEEYDLHELESCLKEPNFKLIASRTDLFWQAFCKVSARGFPPSKLNYNDFALIADPSRSSLRMMAKKPTLERLLESVEIIRRFFEESFNWNEPVTIMPIWASDCHHLVRKRDVVNLDDCPKIFWGEFEVYIRPALPALARLLHMSGVPADQKQKGFYKNYGVHKYSCKTFTIQPLTNSGQST